MFFISKVINFFLSPLIWVIIIQIVIVFINNKKIKKRLILINLCVLLFFSNSHLSALLVSNWEMNIIPEREIVKKYDYGIVPGGFSNYFPMNERLQFNNANDRLMQTINLYYNKKINKIIVTGGSGRILNQEEKESVYVKEYLLNIGIPEKDVLIEDQSRNTYENAMNVASLYGSDTCSYLLITSAFHIRRALPCYIKQGLQTDPYPVNFKISPEKEKGDFWSGFLPSLEAMISWNLLLKEWLGFVAYKAKRGC